MIGKILMYLIPLLVIADTYIYALFIRKFTQKTALRILWFLPSVILLIGAYFFFASTATDFRSIFAIVFITIALPKILFFVITLLDIPFRILFKWKVYPFSVVGLFVGVAVIFILIYGSTVGKTKFEVKQVEFASPNLPESFDGYKIVQISDLHIGNWGENKAPIEKMVKLVNEQKADAVMITGDLVHNSATELDGFEPILSQIKAPDGVYSILGNHDYGLYKRWESEEKKKENLESLKQRQANMGWKLLNNEHTFLVKGNECISLIGVENEGKPPFPQYGDLTKAMAGAELCSFKLLLSHDPSHWRGEALDKKIDLMLAGHTHGTQFSIGSFSFASLLYDEWGGLYKEGNQGLYVNVGIAHVLLPFRFGAWPEITVITLKKLKP
ncbi:MAG: metallophosphoesterase [Dysgonomonas sp.]